MVFEDECETKIAMACQQVKDVSPTTSCFMYTESDWARTQYSLGNDLDELEGSSDPQGIELFCDGAYPFTWDNATCKGCDPQESFNYVFRAYDFRNSTTRQHWVSRVVDNMGPLGSIDGVFVDGNRDKWSSSVTSSCTSGAKSAWSAGLNESMWDLRKACDSADGPNGCTIISNYATTDAMTMSDGGMIERFGCSVSYISNLMGLAKSGKLAQIHAQCTAIIALTMCFRCVLCACVRLTSICLLIRCDLRRFAGNVPRLFLGRHGRALILWRGQRLEWLR